MDTAEIRLIFILEIATFITYLPVPVDKDKDLSFLTR